MSTDALALRGRPGRVEVDTAGRRLSHEQRRGADGGGALLPRDLRDRDALSWFPDKTQSVQILALRLPRGAG